MAVKKGAAFSLLELLIVIGLLTSVSFISFPYVQQLLMKTQVETQTQAIFAALNTAKKIAIERQTRVVVCPVGKNNRAEFLAHSAQDITCTQGWPQDVIHFTNLDNNGDFTMGDDLILKLEKGVVGIQVNRTKFTFSPLSQATTTAGSINICPSNELKHLAKSVVVSNVGRIRVEQDCNRFNCRD